MLCPLWKPARINSQICDLICLCSVTVTPAWPCSTRYALDTVCPLILSFRPPCQLAKVAPRPILWAVMNQRLARGERGISLPCHYLDLLRFSRVRARVRVRTYGKMRFSVLLAPVARY